MNENIKEDLVRKLQKILGVIESQAIRETLPVGEIRTLPCGYKENNDIPAWDAMQPFPEGARWGETTDAHAWFRFNVTVPDGWETDRAELLVETERNGWDASNPQFILYVNGKMRQGLDTNHRTFVLTEKVNDVALYAYTGSEGCHLQLRTALRRVDTDVEALFFNIAVPFQALSTLHPNTKEYMTIVDAMDAACLLLDMRKIPSPAFSASVKAANRYLEKEFYGKACGKSEITTVGIGHTHIDCAWLWTLRQTREKVQRTFSTVLELMDRYPEYKFMSSQALLYKDLKEEAPEVYERVKQKIKEGRWEVEGAMWVEADCNLSSGESLVRQVTYGRRFFREEFGVESRVLWLPDVFGYSAALPQILRKANVDWFLTSKISWNETNMMPYDVFTWTGIDGTPIRAYFLTAQNKGRGNDIGQRYATYNGDTNPPMIAGTWNRFQQKNLTNEALLTFGFGDGGGGPTAGMLENLRREKFGIPGLPKATNEFAGDFLRRLERRVAKDPALPTWRGELYLEFHRGTYTSQAKNKRNNRKSEFLYENTELLSEMARVTAGAAYPAKELRDGWETILTNQFHDIIPGSSIHDVYVQCDKDYAALREKAEALRNRALAAVAARVKTDEAYLVFNPHSFPNSGAVKIGGRSCFVKNVPAKGFAAVTPVATDSRVKINGKSVETPFFRVKFDDQYQIASLYDKKNRRRVLTGKGNVIEVYEDFPYNYDAWEISPYHKEKHTVMDDVSSVETVDDGCRRGVKITRRHFDSTFTQTVWFYDDVAKIDFETEADWKEKHQLVKCAFPVDVNSDKATYEVQFGTVERPTHSNTSWDRAKFEVCAQKYADLSDNGYGVSILNDCKYGHDIHDGTIRLSLIKCADYPDPEADRCLHRFTYSICPHAGALKDSDTLHLAYDLNVPMTAIPAVMGDGTLPEQYSFLSVNRPNVIAETVKKADDSDDTVVRLYEAQNKKTPVTVKFGFDVSRVAVCDLEENELRTLPVKGNAVRFTVDPFEIVTLKACK